MRTIGKIPPHNHQIRITTTSNSLTKLRVPVWGSAGSTSEQKSQG
jgi:hypothetical protein